MSDSSTTEQSPQDTASDPLECKDDEQPDEGLKRKLDDEESPDEIPEKKLKSEHEDDDKKEEDSGNPIINDEETAETHLDGDEIENKHETEQKDDEINSEKKDSESKDKKKVQNLRKNIKDVIDDSQLDATTLAAQRQESERLARLQEQQKLIREAQRQAACEKQQQKVLSLLKVEDDDEQIPENGENSIDPFLEKFSIKPNVDIKEAAKATLESIQSIITSDQNEESEDDDCVLQQTDPLLTTEKPKTVVVDSSSSDSDDCIILSDEEVDEDEDEDVANSGEHTNDTYNTRDAQGRVVVNIGHNESEPDIFVAPQIARIIKPHQIGGVRFLYDNIIESTELFDKSTGFGCILAHSMGLGKTLQMVCFCDIFLRHTSSKKILLIMPINTLQNWLNEFNMWLPLPEDVDKCPLQSDGEVRPRTFKIFVLNESLKSLTARSKVVLDWSEQGGVLIMGYEMYRLLSLRKTRTKRKKGIIVDTTTSRDREMFEGIFEALVNPGPDLVVCDEGHRIKNSVATTSHALKQIKTKRRVVLTGYPLQNNLLEYWCMVDFVRPSYLGTRNEFCNMFERPIQNGQCIDSTPNDFKLMRYRAHVLHSLLKGFVQRRSHTVLQKSLPDKTEFVILVRMTKFQRKLYEVFMNEVVRSRKVPNPLKAFAVCCKIWNHPDVLYTFLKKREADLDLEVDDEAESVNKKETSKSNSVKSTVKPIVEPVIETKSVEDESKIKPPLSVDSAYSSTQSSYDSNNSFYNNYQQTYDNQQQQYPNWNGKYYQENSYYSQGNYFSSNSSQSSYYSNNSNYQSFNSHSDTSSQQQQQQQKIPEKIGGLLEDVIEKEKEEENNKELSSSRNSKDDGIPYDWAVELMKDYVPDLLENSPKLELFFCVLDESIRIGDRILVFSQSLLTLNLLEKFLQKSQIPGQDKNFAKNTSYFRLDGCTTALEREKLINEFNKNEDVKLFLVSTRAGSLGINLVGANRVIVFDASWNPCHDTQAVCRVYRYGQSKKCFVYRFVMDNCLEKKIYDRQINKQGMADRIVDECNPDAHLSMKEVTSLCYEDGEDPDVKDFNEIIDNYEDVIAKKILQNHYKSLTKEPFSHESLLVDRKEKKLSVAEKRLAQRGYEMEKQAANKPSYNYNANIRMYRTTDGSLIQRPVGSGRPTASDYSNNISENRNNQQEKPTRWVPVEVWQSKGISAQEMTLPQDVAIQTNSSEKAKIYLKAGQKVIVLKSSKGICLQLQSGKVIAIRASQKPGLPLSKPDAAIPRMPPRQDGDVIDISNDDDEESGNSVRNNVDPLVKEASNSNPTDSPAKTVEHSKPDNMYKENKYRPNLLPRKPRPTSTLSPSTSTPLPPSNMHNQRSDSKFQPPAQSRWESPSQSNYSNNSNYQRNGNVNNSTSQYRSTNPLNANNTPSQQSSSSAFFTPPPYIPPQYPQPPTASSSNQMYQSSSYPNSNFHHSSHASGTNFNYPYPSYSNPPPPPQTSTYPPYASTQSGYDYPPYQPYNSYPVPPTHSSNPYPTHDTTPTPPNPYASNSNSNFSQWNYNT